MDDPTYELTPRAAVDRQPSRQETSIFSDPPQWACRDTGDPRIEAEDNRPVGLA